MQFSFLKCRVASVTILREKGGERFALNERVDDDDGSGTLAFKLPVFLGRAVTD